MNWQKNKKLAITRDNTPSLTDQAGARDTDINVIVGQFLVHGQVPGAKGQPLYEDFTQLPKDLRGFIEMGRTLKDNQKKLPEKLQGIPLAELVGMTTEKINAILKPPEEKKENKETP